MNSRDLSPSIELGKQENFSPSKVNLFQTNKDKVYLLPTLLCSIRHAGILVPYSMVQFFSINSENIKERRTYPEGVSVCSHGHREAFPADVYNWWRKIKHLSAG